ncbi:cysteine desulfurase [bacterium]|nr:cysteine desulfurase [bacterium]
MKIIYLDHASACPLDQRVLAFGRKYLEDTFGNPSSLYSTGLEAKTAIESARQKVAGFINAEDEKSIIFTSGATESSNLAIRGTALRNMAKGQEIVASAIEHISVFNPMKELQKQGFKLTIIPVDHYGHIDLRELEKAVSPETIVTSVMYANNEIGTIQPIREISEIVHRKGIYFHVDACAAAGHIPIDVQSDGIDLLSLSSNALYGPQGVGALYIKPGVKIQTIMPGGGQERGLRSGTENIFGIAAMGEAARIAKEDMEKDRQNDLKIRDELIRGILKVEDSYLTGHPVERLPHHASFRFARIEGESILLSMDMFNIQIATGSACSSQTLEASRVLLAIGLKHEEAHGSMVITLGRQNREEEVAPTVEAVKNTVAKLRMLSPL